jgi:hypothetical protein
MIAMTIKIPIPMATIGNIKGEISFIKLLTYPSISEILEDEKVKKV